MNFESAEHTRIVRCYQWALERARTEVEEGYPLLGRVRDAGSFGLLLNLRTYPETAQMDLMLLNVQKHHPAALALLGEKFEGEMELKRRMIPVWQGRVPFNIAEFEQQYFESPSPKKPVTRKFLKLVLETLESLAATEPIVSSPTRAIYETSIGDWTIQTIVGLQDKKIKSVSCSHTVYRRDHDDNAGFGRAKAIDVPRILNHGQTSFTGLLGFPGATSWAVAFEDDVPVVLSEIRQVCTCSLAALSQIVQDLN
jgi:hypothetical protein